MLKPGVCSGQEPQTQTSEGKVRLFPLESAEPVGSRPPVMEIERTCEKSQNQESLEDPGLLQAPSPSLIKTLKSRGSDAITVAHL